MHRMHQFNCSAEGGEIELRKDKNGQKKKETQRRNPGRNPRIPFSSQQVAQLEAKFVQTPYLSSGEVSQLATCLNLSDTRVKIWFQNRRARERREREISSCSLEFETVTQSPSTKNEEKTETLVQLPIDCNYSTPKTEKSPQTFEKYIWPINLISSSRNEHWKSVPIYMKTIRNYQHNPNQYFKCNQDDGAKF